jgi:hypothetical protein
LGSGWSGWSDIALCASWAFWPWLYGAGRQDEQKQSEGEKNQTDCGSCSDGVCFHEALPEKWAMAHLQWEFLRYRVHDDVVPNTIQ